MSENGELAEVPDGEDEIGLPRWNLNLPVALSHGKVFIPLAAICAALQLDTNTQIRRIKRHRVLAKHLRMFRLKTVKGMRPTQCISERVLGFWLGTIGVEHVRADLQDWLAEFQEDVIEAAGMILVAHLSGDAQAPEKLLDAMRRHMLTLGGDQAAAWQFMKMLEKRLGHLEDEVFGDEGA